jgi:hypothetical protein
MKRLTVVVLLSVSAAATAQMPNRIPGGGAAYPPLAPPTFGNRPQQSPISPYLNLLNGTGNPATNYYNFARPLLQPPPSPFAPPLGSQPGAFPQQTGFLPPAALPAYESATPFEPTGSLPPTGHPVLFGNKYGQASGGARTGFFPPPQNPTTGRTQTIPKAK